MIKIKFLVYEIHSTVYFVEIFTTEYIYYFKIEDNIITSHYYRNNHLKNVVLSWKQEKACYGNIEQVKGRKRYKLISKCQVHLQDMANDIYKYLTT